MVNALVAASDLNRSSTENRYETKVTQPYLSPIYHLSSDSVCCDRSLAPQTSAVGRRSEIKLIGTWEVRLTEDRIATTATRLIQHSEHEIRGQVSRPGPVSRHLTTVRKILEIHFAITMLFAGGCGVSFFAFDGLGDGAGRLSDRCSGTRGRT